MTNLLSNHVLLEAAERFGTPTYLYDIDCIEEKYNTLRKLLSNRCDIFYSMKANPAMAICKEFKNLGSHCEVSSYNELLMALEAGFDPNQIIFVGPGKSRRELVLAIEKNIRYIVCESIHEIKCIHNLAKKIKKVVPILIRINPNFTVVGSPIKMSGVATQFGIDIDDFLKNSHDILALSFVHVDGIQVYNASRVLHFNSIVNNIRNIFFLAKELSNQSGIKFNVIDFGGGFGVPYFENEIKLDIKLLLSEINTLIDSFLSENKDFYFIMEMGRYLVAESGYLISSVQYIKKSHDKNYIVLDAGMNCFLGATGIGSFVHRNFPMRFISKNNNKKYDASACYQITGPLCTPGDTLLKNVILYNISIDDLIILEKTGAYGLTASPGKFLSHGSPAEVVFKKSRFLLSRRREELFDLLATQVY